MVSRGAKFTGICIAIYLVYAIFVFFILPFMLPSPVDMVRSIVTRQTAHLGDLRNYTLETGGNPKRSLLVMYRGSGALSLLDALTRQAGGYHHFAPLVAYNDRLTEKQDIDLGLEHLVSLFNCDYSHARDMLYYAKRTPLYKHFYGVQWEICQAYSNEVCWNPDTMSKICKLFPFINMSVYNLRLQFIAALLKRKDLNVNIVLLIRDPRDIINSRANRVWCSRNVNCTQPHHLCENMVMDHMYAMHLQNEFPQRFRVVYYEDMAQHPQAALRKIFDFFGLPIVFTNDTPLYFEAPNTWTTGMINSQVLEVENACREAMKLWKYQPAFSQNDVSVDDTAPSKQKKP